MDPLKQLDEEMDRLLNAPARMLAVDTRNLYRFIEVLPVWARLQHKEVVRAREIEKESREVGDTEQPSVASALEEDAQSKMYALWEKLSSDEGTIYRGNAHYGDWAEARISIIKATARLDGQTGSMIRAALHDGSLIQRSRAFWAYLNLR